MGYYYDESGGMQPTPPEKKKSEFASWAGIAVLFAIGLWPVGLYLLISKLTDDSDRKTSGTSAQKGTASAAPSAVRGDRERRGKVGAAVEKLTKTPQYGSKGAAAMKWIGIALLALGGLAALGAIGGNINIYAGTDRLLWNLVGDLFYPVGIMAGGAGVLLGSRSMTRRQRRFAKYLTVAGTDSAVSLERLARAAEVSEKKLHHDLEIMVEKGMWGQEAYVDQGAGMLFRSHEAARQYDARNTLSHAVPREAKEGYSGILRQIREANDRIADPILSQKIDRLEDLTGRIFRIIEKEPQKKAKAATFLNFYLPTTQKLLNSYAEFEETGVSGTNLDQAKDKIQRTMDNIVEGFAHQLDMLYQDHAMDIDSDIRVMETMLRRDNGSAARDFGLDGTAVEYEEE